MSAGEALHRWWTAWLDTPVREAVGQGLTRLMDLVDTPILVYFLLINTSYLVLILIGSVEFARHLRRAPYAGLDEVASSPLTLPVSVIVSAYNEEAGIVSSVRATLALRYPQLEVVVVDDGSKDATFERLRDTFDLVQVPRPVPDLIATKRRAESVYQPVDGRTPLLVIRKQNSGKSDSMNVGVNAASYPLVAFIDADSILDPDALLQVAKPFADDPDRMIGTGGVVRAANGCRVVAGRVVSVGMPRQILPRIQVLEYLRAFLLGRTAWSRLDCLILISGAFGLFRRDVVIKVGGLDPDCIGEDFELVMRMHKVMREQRIPYRMRFVAEPVLWTEVPSTAAVLGRQRRRWHRGLWEVLWKYRGALFNPRWGRLGWLIIPYFWLFELLAPVLELAGVIIVLLGLATGSVSPQYGVEFVLVAYLYAIFVSCAAIVIEEFSFHRYPGWRDLWLLFVAVFAENLGYRQLTAWWRVRGLWQGIRGGEHRWGTMTRTGFGDPGAGASSSDVAMPVDS